MVALTHLRHFVAMAQTVLIVVQEMVLFVSTTLVRGHLTPNVMMVALAQLQHIVISVAKSKDFQEIILDPACSSLHIFAWIFFRVIDVRKNLQKTDPIGQLGVIVFELLVIANDRR